MSHHMRVLGILIPLGLCASTLGDIINVPGDQPTIQDAIAFYGDNFIQLKGLGFTCTLEKLVKLKLLGASFAEVPFVLRYDKKQSASKMITSITTLGYLIMAIAYHWPWGGWRRYYTAKRRASAAAPVASSEAAE